ncbi:Protein of unknown function [Gryllus bimaculatus]|nr:Protein of unknown function [Gryllus bimaculatus]
MRGAATPTDARRVAGAGAGGVLGGWRPASWALSGLAALAAGAEASAARRANAAGATVTATAAADALPFLAERGLSWPPLVLCPHCPRRCYRQGNLLRHMRARHPELCVGLGRPPVPLPPPPAQLLTPPTPPAAPRSRGSPSPPAPPLP